MIWGRREKMMTSYGCRQTHNSRKHDLVGGLNLYVFCWNITDSLSASITQRNMTSLVSCCFLQYLSDKPDSASILTEACDVYWRCSRTLFLIVYYILPDGWAATYAHWYHGNQEKWVEDDEVQIISDRSIKKILQFANSLPIETQFKSI